MKIKLIILFFVMSFLLIFMSCNPLVDSHFIEIKNYNENIVTYTNDLYFHFITQSAKPVKEFAVTTTDKSTREAAWSEVPYVELPAESYGTYTFYGWAKDSKGAIIDKPKEITVEYKPFSGNWTVMVWIAADNDLETFAIDDINEMEYGFHLATQKDASFSEKVAMVVQIDRGNHQSSNNPDYSFEWGVDKSENWDTTRRYLIKPDSTNLDDYARLFRSQRLADLGEVNMGDAQNLKEFIAYSKANFPADNYALILWNHGGGVRSYSSSSNQTKEVCFDVTDNGDWLYVGEITSVLTDTEDVTVMGFDACLMGMTEIAYQYSDIESRFSTDYFVASAPEEQIDGWEYHKIINRMAGGGFDSEGDPGYTPETLTGENLVHIIAKEYGDAFDAAKAGESMMAIDLSQMDALKTAIYNFATNLASKKSDVFALQSSTVSYKSSLYHYDLYDLMDRVANNGAFTGTEQDRATDVKTAIEAALIYSYGGANYQSTYAGSFQPGKHGLGIIFQNGTPGWYTDTDAELPSGRLDFCEIGADATVDTWKEFLN